MSDSKVKPLMGMPSSSGFTFYGAKPDSTNNCRIPVSFKQDQLSPEVHEYLMSADIFSADEKTDLTTLGFTKCVDHPTLPNHIYYEGYFHALPTSEPVNSYHPRQGRDFANLPPPVESM